MGSLLLNYSITSLRSPDWKRIYVLGSVYNYYYHGENFLFMVCSIYVLVLFLEFGKLIDLTAKESIKTMNTLFTFTFQFSAFDRPLV